MISVSDRRDHPIFRGAPARERHGSNDYWTPEVCPRRNWQ